MIELKETAPGEVTLWEDGREAGGAAWRLETLAWGREACKAARLSRFQAEAKNRPALRAYLEYLWSAHGVAAAAYPDGQVQWFHRALEKSWRAAGEPWTFTPATGQTRKKITE